MGAPRRESLSMRRGKSGFVLAFTLGIILALTLLFAILLGLPGNVRREAMRVAADVQEVYDAESSLLLHLAGIPHSAVAGAGLELSPVIESSLGPYVRLCAGTSVEVCALTVSRLQALSYREWHAGMQAYRDGLRERIVSSSALRSYSGNRRLSEAPGLAYMCVQDGDLRLTLAGHVPSFNAVVSGDVAVDGNAVYDTLRLHASGNVTLKGGVQIGFLEVAAGERVEVSGSVHFRGMLSARREVRLRGRTVAAYPSMAIAIGQNGTEVDVAGGVQFAGLRAAFPGDACEGDTVMPAFMDGRKVVFGREVNR